MIKNKDEKQMAGKERVKPESERENMWESGWVREKDRKNEGMKLRNVKNERGKKWKKN